MHFSAKDTNSDRVGRTTFAIFGVVTLLNYVFTGVKVWQKRRKMAQTVPASQNPETHSTGCTCLTTFGCISTNPSNDHSLVDFRSFTLLLLPICLLLLTPLFLSLTSWLTTGMVDFQLILRGSLLITILLTQPLCIYVRKNHVRKVLKKELRECIRCLNKEF